MKRIILFILLTCISINLYSDTPNEFASDDLKLNGFKALYNREMLYIYQNLSHHTKSFVEVAREIATLTVAGQVSNYARDILTEPKDNLQSGNVQDSLWELDDEKLHKSTAISTNDNTMSVNFIVGGALSRTANLGIGPDVTPDYPLHIQRPSPQILIQTEGQIGGYFIIVDTSGYNTNPSTATEIVADAEWAGRELGGQQWSGSEAIVSWDDKLWILGGDVSFVGQTDMWYSEDTGHTWQEHSETLPYANMADWPKCAGPDGIYCFSGQRVATKNYNAVYKFDGNTWTLIKANSGSDPMADDNADMIYWPKDGYFYLTGNTDTDLIGYEHDLSKSTDCITWTKVIDHDASPYTGEAIAELVIHGTELLYFGQTNLYSTSDGETWTNETDGSSNKYTARTKGLAYSDGTTLYIAGGQSGNTVVTDAMYSTDKANWTEIVSDLGTGNVVHRGHIYHNGSALIMGGTGGNDSVWLLNLAADTAVQYNYYAIKQKGGKELLRLSEKDNRIYLNGILSLKLFNTTRGIQDDGTTIGSLTDWLVGDTLYFEDTNMSIYRDTTTFSLIVSTDMIVNGSVDASTFTGYGGLLNVLNSTETLDEFLSETIPSGLLHAMTITDDGGLDYSWTSGENHVNGSILETVSGSAVAANNDRSYLYATIAGGTVLSTSTTLPEGDYALIATIDTYNNDIEHIYTREIISEITEDIEEHLESIHNHVIDYGLLVAIDTDGTNANDFTVASGVYYHAGLDKHTVLSTLYSAGSNHSSSSTTWYYHYATTWTNSSGNGVDFDRWDNGTGTTTVNNVKWYSGWIFLTEEDEVEYVYPQTEHAKESLAVAETITYPPFHAEYTTTLAKFIFRGDQSGFGAKAYLIDIRPLHTFGFQTSVSYAVQDLWKTIAGDSGSTDANLSYDTLGILGGDSLTSVMSGDNLTMNLDEDISVSTVTFSDGTSITTAGTGLWEISLTGGLTPLDTVVSYDIFWEVTDGDNLTPRD